MAKKKGSKAYYPGSRREEAKVIRTYRKRLKKKKVPCKTVKGKGSDWMVWPVSVRID